MGLLNRWRKPRQPRFEITTDTEHRLITLENLRAAWELKKLLDATTERLVELYAYDTPQEKQIIAISLKTNEVLTQRELVAAVIDATRKCWVDYASQLRKLGIDPGLMPAPLCGSGGTAPMFNGWGGAGGSGGAQSFHKSPATTVVHGQGGKHP